MTNMFKKTLVATAILAVSGSAFAAELSAPVAEVTDAIVSAKAAKERTQIADATFRVPAFHLVSGVNYTNGDTVRITFSGTAVKQANLESVVQLVPAIDVTGTDQTAVAAAGQLDLISVTVVGGNTEALYRVSGATTPGSNGKVSGNFIKAAAGGDVSAALVTADLTATVKSFLGSSTTEIDTSGAAAKRTNVKLITLFDQFSTFAKRTNDLTAEVDVAQDRKKFTTAGGASGTSVVGAFLGKAQEVSGNPVTLDASYATTVAKVAYELTGQFGWALKADGTVNDASVYTVQCDNAAGSAPVAATEVAITATKLTFECASATVHFPKITLNTNKMSSATIPTNDFSLKATFTVNNGVDTTKTATKSFTIADAGKWTLNGSSVHIPYMPYGEGISQVINLNNAGSQVGDINVEGFDRTGKKFGPVKVGTTAANTQHSLAAAIKTAVEAAGMGSERVSLTLVTNVKASDVTVFSAYNVASSAGARLVVNSSNGKGSN